jgi:sterol desaturase/sphingolipid hydroxylase (fatty acid hydroxylase superfamily)
VLIGGSPWVFVAYEFVFQLNTLFQHSNVRVPIAAERWLSLVLVTPRMHGTHYSQVAVPTFAALLITVVELIPGLPANPPWPRA